MNGPPHMSLARAEFKIGNKVQKISVMIERPSLRDSGGSKSARTSDLVTVAEYLAHHLIASNATAGMLSCLGCRVKQKLELIFQIPPELGRPQTLSACITAVAMPGNHIDEQFRTQRQQLSRQLSLAVCPVHEAQLVHKIIRPQTIVMLDSVVEDVSGSEDGFKLELPFFTNWDLLGDKTHPQEVQMMTDSEMYIDIPNDRVFSPKGTTTSIMTFTAWVSA